MSFYKQFDNFEPLIGDVPSHPFTYMPAIARRARVMLRSCTSEQIAEAAKKISQEIDDYFFNLNEETILRLRIKMNAGDKAFERYFERVGGTGKNGHWLFKDEMAEDLGIATAKNSSEVDILKLVIDTRDYSGYNLPTLPIPKEFSEGRDFQLFAVLSLWLLSDALNFLDKKQSDDLSIAGEYALKAMDAVCYSEHLYEAAWLVSFTKNLSDKELTEMSLKEKSEREEWLQNYTNHEIEKAKKKRSEQARNAANALHSLPGGSREKSDGIRAIWKSGKYITRNKCAEKECVSLGMSYTTARKALINTPDPT